MAKVNKEERLTAYKAILTKEGGLKAEDALALLDMVTTDLTVASELDTQNDALANENTELKGTNHKLFLRVTEDKAPPQQEDVKTREDVKASFEELIKKGEL